MLDSVNPDSSAFDVLETAGRPIKAWTHGVPFEPAAQEQLRKLATLPIIHGWIAVMPDVHKGIGATVGSVVPTLGAIIPSAVGVDIGCGMMAVKTSLTASDLPENLHALRTTIERAVPHGRTHNGRRGDRGAWSHPPASEASAWRELEPGYREIVQKHPVLDRGASVEQLGTLGTGNHFIELSIDEAQAVWVVLHSGSRGVGNRIGSYFISLAREEMHHLGLEVPDRDLGYLREGTASFDDYVHAVGWAQEFARCNRELMMQSVLDALARSGELPPFTARLEAVNCHHNYVQKERHLGEELFVTRKGAVRAGAGELGIIPGSMGARTFIVRGKGNPESFESCSHGAGRKMSRTEAKKRFTLADHARATAGVECRKDEGVIDETPMAYKDIDAVMAAQRDLVEVVHTLGQVISVKG